MKLQKNMLTILIIIIIIIIRHWKLLVLSCLVYASRFMVRVCRCNAVPIINVTNPIFFNVRPPSALPLSRRNIAGCQFSAVSLFQGRESNMCKQLQ